MYVPLIKNAPVSSVDAALDLVIGEELVQVFDVFLNPVGQCGALEAQGSPLELRRTPPR